MTTLELVFTNTHYDEIDYIENYDEFKRLKNGIL